MKKLFFTCITCLVLSTLSLAQVVNSITIIPSNPSTTDTIKIISDFSYFGNCSFGLVSQYTWFTDSTIHVEPTYCGYGATTLCNSIDTFNIGTYPIANYIIRIDYHQGSVCPFSGFDATIAQFDTTFTVSPTSGLLDNSHEKEVGISIYPNPNEGRFSMKSESKIISLEIKNILGVRVYYKSTNAKLVEIDLLDQKSAIYIYHAKMENGQYQSGKISIQ